MSEDLIKRSDAIKAVKRISENYTGKGKRNYHPHIDFIIDELKYGVPSADRQQEWIPCSERLPEEWTDAFFTEINKRTGTKYVGVSPIIKSKQGDGCEAVMRKWHADDSEIVAWMPLPEPWKGADDD